MWSDSHGCIGVNETCSPSNDRNFDDDDGDDNGTDVYVIGAGVIACGAVAGIAVFVVKSKKSQVKSAQNYTVTNMTPVYVI